MLADGSNHVLLLICLSRETWLIIQANKVLLNGTGLLNRFWFLVPITKVQYNQCTYSKLGLFPTTPLEQVALRAKDFTVGSEIASLLRDIHHEIKNKNISKKKKEN